MEKGSSRPESCSAYKNRTLGRGPPTQIAQKRRELGPRLKVRTSRTPLFSAASKSTRAAPFGRHLYETNVSPSRSNSSRSQRYRLTATYYLRGWTSISVRKSCHICSEMER